MAVADRHSERIGGIVGLRNLIKIEDYPRHLLHLLLFGASVTDDALRDLQGRILKNRDTVLLRGEDRNSPRLADIDNRFGVVIIEKLLYRHRFGLIFFHKLRDSVVYALKPEVERHPGGRCHRAVVEHGEVVVFILHNTAADYCISGIDTENYHFLFDSLSLIIMRVGVPSRPNTERI